jgi:hypothetical protein
MDCVTENMIQQQEEQSDDLDLKMWEDKLQWKLLINNQHNMNIIQYEEGYVLNKTVYKESTYQ